MKSWLSLCVALFAFSSHAGKIMCGDAMQIDENHQNSSLVYRGQILPLLCDGNPKPAWMSCKVTLANAIFEMEFKATRRTGHYHVEISKFAGDPAARISLEHPISCDHAE